MSKYKDKYYRASSCDNTNNYNQNINRCASPSSYAQCLNSYLQYRNNERSASVFTSRPISPKLRTENLQFDKRSTPERRHQQYEERQVDYNQTPPERRHQQYEERQLDYNQTPPEPGMPNKIRKRRRSRWEQIEEEQPLEHEQQQKQQNYSQQYPFQQYKPAYYGAGQSFSGPTSIRQDIWQNIRTTPPPPSVPPPPMPPEPPLPPDVNGINDRYQHLNSSYDNYSYGSQNRDNVNDSFRTQRNDSDIFIKRKQKRRTLPARHPMPKDTPASLIEMVLKVERELKNTKSDDTTLIVRFPDPEITKEMVKAFSEDIKAINFHQNISPRFCFVHLKESANVQETIEKISNIEFGTGKLTAEISNQPAKSNAEESTNLDPYTLYVGNLSAHLPAKLLKDYFPDAQRVDIGYAQRMKLTKYAFVRFAKVEVAIEAYKRMLYKEIEGRQIILRFKRWPADYGSTANGKCETVDDSFNISHQYDVNDERLMDAEKEEAAISKETISANANHAFKNSNNMAKERESTPDWDAEEDLEENTNSFKNDSTNMENNCEAVNKKSETVDDSGTLSRQCNSNDEQLLSAENQKPLQSKETVSGNEAHALKNNKNMPVERESTPDWDADESSEENTNNFKKDSTSLGNISESQNNNNNEKLSEENHIETNAEPDLSTQSQNSPLNPIAICPESTAVASCGAIIASNIKLEPDTDPDDIITVNDSIGNRFDQLSNHVKEEPDDDSNDVEFFSGITKAQKTECSTETPASVNTSNNTNDKDNFKANNTKEIDNTTGLPPPAKKTRTVLDDAVSKSIKNVSNKCSTKEGRLQRTQSSEDSLDSCINIDVLPDDDDLLNKLKSKYANKSNQIQTILEQQEQSEAQEGTSTVQFMRKDGNSIQRVIQDYEEFFDVSNKTSSKLCEIKQEDTSEDDFLLTRISPINALATESDDFQQQTEERQPPPIDNEIMKSKNSQEISSDHLIPENPLIKSRYERNASDLQNSLEDDEDDEGIKIEQEVNELFGVVVAKTYADNISQQNACRETDDDDDDDVIFVPQKLTLNAKCNNSAIPFSTVLNHDKASDRFLKTLYHRQNNLSKLLDQLDSDTDDDF